MPGYFFGCIVHAFHSFIVTCSTCRDFLLGIHTILVLSCFLNLTIQSQPNIMKIDLESVVLLMTFPSSPS